MKRIFLVLTIALMAATMLTLSVSAAYATKPTTMTLSGDVYVIGAGTGTEFPAGKSGIDQVKIRDMPFILTGDIVATGLYDANLIGKSLVPADFIWHGTWTMEVATINGIGTGSLKFGSLWDDTEPFAEWWITGATGDLSGLKGRGIATQTGPFVYHYEFEVQIP